MIYLIVDTTNTVCKIGYSNDPEKRLTQLQTANPNQLELVAIIHGDISAERALHRKFKPLRLKGEWFYYDEEIKKFFNVHEPLPIVFLDMEWVNLVNGLAEFKVLVWLWKSSGYINEDVNILGNQVIVNQRLIDIISNSTGLKSQTIRSTITKLHRKKLIIKDKDYRGVYYMNPQYFFKGALSDRLKKVKVVNNYFINKEE